MPQDSTSHPDAGITFLEVLWDKDFSPSRLLFFYLNISNGL
jgi:hypothetical protein